MRVVIQRVSQASVSIDGKVKSSINQGFMILLGVGNNDGPEDIQWLVRKIVALRIFDDADGVMNLSIKDIDGEILVVSQFTLMASCKKGNRPSWLNAAPHSISIPLYEQFCKELSAALGKPVGTGEFGAMMDVSLVNNYQTTFHHQGSPILPSQPLLFHQIMHQLHTETHPLCYGTLQH